LQARPCAHFDRSSNVARGVDLGAVKQGRTLLPGKSDHTSALSSSHRMLVSDSQGRPIVADAGVSTVKLCRAGFPGHFGEPWSNYDNVEIDFVIQYKHLTDAGYNVLTYDIRNHGNSSAANNGICGIGRWEWRDCVGVKKYVDRHPRLSKMKVGLYSQCMGGNSQYKAIARDPELFGIVRCMCSPLVPSMSAIFQAFSELQGVSQHQELIDLELLKMGAFPAADMTPQLFASAITMPNLTIQVRDDAWTKNPEDAQKTFDMLGTKDKEMIWVENTTRRFKDGYNYFGRFPEKVLAFFDKHMK
jgi:hypothetical protein